MKTKQVIDNCWLRTFTGKVIDPKNPRVEDITIEDIARGLSNHCRFSGQCNKFYSVASHSLLVHNLYKKNEYDDPVCLLGALLHDSTEAYLSDIATPFKRMIPQYKKLELKLMNIIESKFNILGTTNNNTIKFYDKEALTIEMSVLFDNNMDDRVITHTPDEVFPIFMSTAYSYLRYM